MDGNGRWATRQGRSRSAGHRAGAAMVRRIVEAAPDLGIGVLTLYAFSADNWRRPQTEVGWLMRLFREYLRVETPRCVANGVRLEVIGRRDRISPALRQARPMIVSQRVTERARIILELDFDFGVRKNTPIFCTRPWMQATVTAHPRLKKVYIDWKAVFQDSLRALRSTHTKRQPEILSPVQDIG
jgi:undecaprenyl diphosphate synthase